MDYKEHHISWTSEKISRFWNFYHSSSLFEETFFSKQVGDGIVNFVNKYVALGGNILDYGTGPGFLIEHLLKKDCGFIWGCDFSLDSMNKINAKFKDFSNFKGAMILDKIPSSLPGKFFDYVFLIETIEHLNDECLKNTITEIRRILVDRGTLIISVPNNENIDLHKVICPDCGAIFHRVQHLRSFSKPSLNDLMESFGFKKNICEETELSWYKSMTLLSFAKRMLVSSRKVRLPNLIYIGRKKG